MEKTGLLLALLFTVILTTLDGTAALLANASVSYFVAEFSLEELPETNSHPSRSEGVVISYNIR